MASTTAANVQAAPVKLVLAKDVVKKRKSPFPMGRYCSVVNCHNSDGKLKRWQTTFCEEHVDIMHMDCPCLLPYKLHSFPANEDMRKFWAAALRRKDFHPTVRSVVCSNHFIDGRPTNLNPVPTLNLGHNVKVVVPRRSVHVRNRLLHSQPTGTEKRRNLDQFQAGIDTRTPVLGHPVQSELIIVDCTPVEAMDLVPTTSDAAVQCDLLRPSLIKLTSSTQTEKMTSNKRLMANIPEYTYARLKNEKVHFYTGLSKDVVDGIIKVMEEPGNSSPCKLLVCDQLLMVLMRLKLGLLMEDVADRFRVSRVTASRICNKMGPILHEKFGELVYRVRKKNEFAKQPV